MLIWRRNFNHRFTFNDCITLGINTNCSQGNNGFIFPDLDYFNRGCDLLINGNRSFKGEALPKVNTTFTGKSHAHES